MSGLVLLVLITVVQAALLLNDENKAIQSVDSFGNFFIVPSELDKLKRSFGRNCVFTISGCFTSSQAERYRKYMENVRFIPKRRRSIPV
uniref:Uncharacterized protein n=1 Tax=Caenorhabditis japonica TaxID=281687 RepID=A0A8R1HXG2_CAEJA